MNYHHLLPYEIYVKNPVETIPVITELLCLFAQFAIQRKLSMKPFTVHMYVYKNVVLWQIWQIVRDSPNKIYPNSTYSV